MSIATDEALEWHGLHGDEPGDRDSTYSAEELDAAYIAGRTAPVTDIEVEAAAFAHYKAVTNANYDPSEADYTHSWENQSPIIKDDFRRKARIDLEAARKAVTE